MLKDYKAARLALYGLALTAMAASFFMTAVDSPLAPAFVQTANLLGAAAGGTAISNIGTLTRRPGDLAADPDFVDDEIPLGFGDETAELTPVADVVPDAGAPIPRHAARS